MATEKSAEAKKDVEPKKATATGEKSVEFIVDGMTEEELKGVAGGLTTGVVSKMPMRCVDVSCDGFNSKCYAFCTTMSCPHVNCEELKCTSYQMS